MKKAAFSAVVLWAGSALAFPSGPVASFGYVISPTVATAVTGGSGTTNVNIGPMTGPQVQAGYEIGDYVNSQFTLLYTSASGPINGSGSGVTLTGTASFQMYGFGYQLTWDIFGKQGISGSGFTPYLGGGLELGAFNLNEPITASGGGQAVSSTGEAQGKPYLEFHATVGARYTLSNGLGFRADVLYSTFGGFFGTFIPSLWVTYKLV